MKTKNFLVAALTMTMLASCNNENDAVDNGTTQGEDTYIGLTIQLPVGAVTKAVDNNAETTETKLTSLKVYCWQTGVAGGMGVPTEIQISDENVTTGANNTYTIKSAIKAKTGANNIFVTANSAPDVTVDQVTAPLGAVSANASTISETNNFAMYSDKVEVVTAVLAEKAAVENGTVTDNTVTTTLRRVAAKIQLTSSLTSTDETGLTDGTGGGKLYDIKWDISRKTNKFYPIVNGDFTDVTSVTSPHDVETDFEANVVPATAVPANGATASNMYTNENAHGGEAYLENNTTAVHVMATYAPATGKYVSNVEGTSPSYNITKGATDMSKGTTFYTLKATDGNLVAGTYFNQAGADAYATLKSGATVATLFNEYTSGICHWAIWLHDGSDKWGVLRNHLYKLNIRSIKAPGYPEIPDTDTPIDTDTWIQVKLDVEAWNMKDMGNVDL
ncbi:Mfa1 family fimbria major subunit [Parabacteroides gordonii]|uniref:Mfa1 family fimbria major subunit n=1 Tax=Parabacteroides gordonii TaxID=574930 RepID=UPI0026EAA63F|nr:Mfa1 family fimbria major subunit [Parabacteroides gordonii]